MHIAVYAFDGITMFHLSIPQMVFGTVRRLGLADWQVSLFTTASETAAPAEGSSGPEAAVSTGTPRPPTHREDPAPVPSLPPTRSIRTSEGYVLSGLSGPEPAGEATSSWYRRGSPTGAPREGSCAHCSDEAHARGRERRRPVPGGRSRWLRPASSVSAGR